MQVKVKQEVIEQSCNWEKGERKASYLYRVHSQHIPEDGSGRGN